MSAALQAPRPAPTAPPEGAPPVAAVDAAESEYAAVRSGFLSPQRSRQSILLLVVTIGLFALAAKQGDQGWKGVALLIGVLLFHEMGHWAGMKLFGFQDVQMFFVPFFGAAVSGRNASAKAWKEALVLMMGPVPGLVVGTFLLVRSAFEPSHLLAHLGLIMLLLNAFNMLPMSPLDGGKLFQLLIFSRNRFLELAFTFFAALGMLGLALLLGTWALGIMAGLLLISLPRQWKVLRIVKELRASSPEVDREPLEMDESSLRSLYTAVGELISNAVKGDNRLKQYVRTMQEVHLRVRMHPPSILASLGLFSLWFMGIVLVLVGILTVGSGRTPKAPEWSSYKDAKAGFSILMPDAAPARWTALHGPARSSRQEGETHGVRLWEEHDYSVTTWKLESPPTTDAEREQVLEEIRSALAAQVRAQRNPARSDEPRELAGIAGRHLVFSGDSAVTRGEVREEYWFGLREDRGYILRAQYDQRLAAPGEAERFFTSFRPLP
ncbi:site-2 protease family protein [Hyalangium gracile]|uniref:site-2 protease family protein n=1 Tax=Hyalangium gracile TaxID=394092 RepID=UPI001CCA3DA3|nr:site-2 protease family protein [Hyalangium gracile]